MYRKIKIKFFVNLFLNLKKKPELNKYSIYIHLNKKRAIKYYCIIFQQRMNRDLLYPT